MSDRAAAMLAAAVALVGLAVWAPLLVEREPPQRFKIVTGGERLVVRFDPATGTSWLVVGSQEGIPRWIPIQESSGK